VTGRALVIGVGNPYRRDDGVGLVILDGLRASGKDRFDVIESTGESSSLVETWTGRSAVIVVDAVSSGALPGTVHRLECCVGSWDVAPGLVQMSSHGAGLAEAVALGQVLGRFPSRLIFLGVEVLDVSAGEGLSIPVAAAVPGIIAMIGVAVAEGLRSAEWGYGLGH
jgi:hydrogenase maturation protease